MPEEILVLLLLEATMTARERRLWIRDQRRLAQAQMLRQVSISVATLTFAVLAVVGTGAFVPR